MKTGSVVVSHLIGTVSLMVIFSIIGTYFTVNCSFIQSDIFVSSLQEVSEYVSAESVDLISLSSLGAEDQVLIKELEIPQLIVGNAYKLSINRSDNLVKIVAQSVSNPSVLGDETLPWSLEGNISFFNGTDPGIDNPRLIPRIFISSLSKNLAVWCLKRGGRVTFGLGVMEG